jgi:hypothetical protein
MFTRKKPGYRALETARKRRKEGPVIKAVRAACVERDGHCIFAPLGPCTSWSEWMHLGEKKRHKTRGMTPEQRHTVEGSAMGCRKHHGLYDRGQIELAMGETGANGPMRAVYQGKVYMLFPVRRREMEA